MRELDRLAANTSPSAPASRPGPALLAPGGIALVGPGRVGTALGRALRERGVEVLGPYGRGEAAALADAGGPDPHAILLCVPDAEIPAAASAVAGRATLIGHTSGATPLSALGGAGGAERFGLHPLQTLTGEADANRLAGAGCAVTGASRAATAFARSLAAVLGLVPLEIAEEGRAAYHAAAAMASNFLVTLADAAEGLAGGAGLDPVEARRALAPLVRATVENWTLLGPERALTGPVARGDDATVAAQREAVERSDPDFLPLFDALVERTRALAGRSAGGALAAAPAGAGR